MSRPAVAVTGLGSVGAAGVGLEAAAAALAAGAAPSSEIDASRYHRGRGARTALVAAGFDAAEWLPPAAMRRMSRPSRYAVAAARMALAGAGLEDEVVANADSATVVATSFGPCEFSERLLLQIYGKGPETASPFLFTESVANAAAAQIALTLGIRGTNVTITQAEAGGLIGLERGAAEIASGRAGRVLCGAVEEMTPLLHAVLDRFSALARDGGDGETARPFDRRRDGFVGADGAVVALLEPLDEAARRGAPILARLRPLGSAFDPRAPAGGWSDDPRALAEALERLLERAGLEPGSFDCIVSGASGARAGDRLEGLVLRRVWAGRELPPVVTPKAVLGEHGGAALVGALVAVAGGDLGARPGGHQPDPELEITPFAGPLEPARRVLVTALAAGGAAAWAAVERPGA